MDGILYTEPSFAFVILRLSLAIIFFAHGSQHLWGLFGGKGPKGQVTNWHEKYSIPIVIGCIGIFTEFVGTLSMVSGFLVRPFALGIAIFIAVALFKSHWEHGFFLTGPGKKGTGIEYCLAIFFIAVALLIGGGGAWSVDHWLAG
jgi:putative oxidoreductase